MTRWVVALAIPVSFALGAYLAYRWDKVRAVHQELMAELDGYWDREARQLLAPLYDEERP